MPYIIVNDLRKPWHYYTGQGFNRGIDTSVEHTAAKTFELSEASAVMKGRSDLYAAGWRIEFVKA